MTTNPTRWTRSFASSTAGCLYRPEEADGFDAPLLAQYNETVRRVAAELGVPLVEVHDAFVAKGPDKLLLDGMHPNDAGH